MATKKLNTHKGQDPANGAHDLKDRHCNGTSLVRALQPKRNQWECTGHGSSVDVILDNLKDMGQGKLNPDSTEGV